MADSGNAQSKELIGSEPNQDSLNKQSLQAKVNRGVLEGATTLQHDLHSGSNYEVTRNTEPINSADNQSNSTLVLSQADGATMASPETHNELPKSKRAKPDPNQSDQQATKMDPRFELFDEPAFLEQTVAQLTAPAADEPDLLEDDPKAFLKFLDENADSEKKWQEQQDELAIHDEFDLVGPENRLTLFNQWAAKRAPSYTDLVKKHWKRGVYYAHFKQRFINHPAFTTSSQYSDKERETIYRDYTRFSKKSLEERKELEDIYKEDKIRLMVLSMLD